MRWLLPTLLLVVVSALAQPNPSRTAADGPSITGSYYGMDGRTLHTWEFHADGTFLHTWVASGAGTSVRNSERGAFRLAGATLELKLSSSATAAATPGVGGRITALAGGKGASTEARSISIRLANRNLVLDGHLLKPKSW